MFLVYTCIYTYVQVYTNYKSIYLYIQVYTKIIILIQGVRIPDDKHPSGVGSLVQILKLIELLSPCGAELQSWGPQNIFLKVFSATPLYQVAYGSAVPCILLIQAVFVVILKSSISSGVHCSALNPYMMSWTSCVCCLNTGDVSSGIPCTRP